MNKHDPYAALRHRAFRLTLLTHALTITASVAQMTAAGWLVYERTNSAAALGFLGLTQFVPVLFLSLLIGHLVDAHSRKVILLFGQIVILIATLGLFAFAGNQHSMWLLYCILTIDGIGGAFISVARPAMMRDVIPSDDAENSSNWSSLSRQISSIIGPLIAGFMIAWSGGAHSTFLIASILMALSLWPIIMIRLPAHTRTSEPLSIRSLLEGVRFIRHTPLILSGTLLDMLAMFLGGATALLPIFTKDILHTGPVALGWLRAAPFIGSALMAFVMTHRAPLKRAGPTLLITVACFGVATVVFGLSRNIFLSFAALFFAGVFDAVSVAIRSTIMQLYIPDRLRGRVYGVNMVFIYSSNDLGEVESGLTAALLGTVNAVVLGGLGSIVVAGAFAAIWKELRQLRELKMQEPAAR